MDLDCIDCGGKNQIKNISVDKLIEIKEVLNSCFNEDDVITKDDFGIFSLLYYNYMCDYLTDDEEIVELNKYFKTHDIDLEMFIPTLIIRVISHIDFNLSYDMFKKIICKDMFSNDYYNNIFEKIKKENCYTLLDYYTEISYFIYNKIIETLETNSKSNDNNLKAHFIDNPNEITNDISSEFFILNH